MTAGFTIVFIFLFMFFIASSVLCFVVYRLLVFKTNAATCSSPLANSLDMVKLLDTFILTTNNIEKLKSLILSVSGG
jgi:hypothetical protein